MAKKSLGTKVWVEHPGSVTLYIVPDEFLTKFLRMIDEYVCLPDEPTTPKTPKKKKK